MMKLSDKAARAALAHVAHEAFDDAPNQPFCPFLRMAMAESAWGSSMAAEHG